MEALRTVLVGEVWKVRCGKMCSREHFQSEVDAADWAAKKAKGRTVELSSSAAAESLHIRWQIEGATLAASGYPISACWNAQQADGWQMRHEADVKSKKKKM